MTLTLEMIAQARNRLSGLLPRTPLVPSETLSRAFGCRVSLKLECLQKTGSFKPRGAFNKMLSLTEDERQRGIVAVSGGNHAQGVAYAARRLGISAIICMPEATPANYLDATRGYGAELALTPCIATAFAEMDRQRQLGRALVHPFDDPLIAAGQGTDCGRGDRPAIVPAGCPSRRGGDERCRRHVAGPGRGPAGRNAGDHVDRPHPGGAEGLRLHARRGTTVGGRGRGR
jgi:hypothetical protein